MTSWVDTVRANYNSDASRQFILHGNTEDLYPVAVPGRGMTAKELRLVGLSDFLQKELLTGFDILIAYSAASGIQIIRGKEMTSQWSDIARAGSCTTHRQAAETL